MPRCILPVSVLLLAAVATARAEPPAVYEDRRNEPELLAAAGRLRDANALTVTDQNLPEQLKHTSCELSLPPANTRKLSGREIWEAARKAYMRVGWFYLCKRCDKWHHDLAGGFVIHPDGAVVTCHHVVQPPAQMKQGYLICVNDAGEVHPVTQVLAANATTDVCILKVKGSALSALPLSTAAVPGDSAYCFSDPMSIRGYFSQGIVNRYFHQKLRQKRRTAEAEPPATVLTMNVSTDWAPGSSGAAVLDEFGNAIGHVARILPVEEAPPRRGSKAGGNGAAGNTPSSEATYMVVHDAVPAQEVLALIHAPR